MPARKYESEQHPEGLLAACFGLLDQLGDQDLIVAPALERQRLLRQVIVNVLLHNPDAHLKNYALVLQNNGKISVSPLYDCLCTYGLNFSAADVSWGQGAGPAAHTHNLSLRIGSANRVDQISQQDWARFAVECGFTAAFVRRMVRELAIKLSDVLPQTIEMVIAQHPLAVPAADNTRQGVTRQVRMILDGS
jgi:serine/threonine-protein kinase HipA